MAAFGRHVPQEKRAMIFGIATAASSFGQFVFAPIGQGFISAFGWATALLYLAAILALAIPLTLALRGRAQSVPGEADMPFMQALARAWGHGSYRLLVIGFFVCGFHIAAMVAAGEQDMAAAKLHALTRLVRISRKRPPASFGFNEWFRAQDGSPAGEDWQTWSASMYLYAAACVETGKALCF